MGGDLLVSGFLVKESMREDYEGKRLDAADAVFSDSDAWRLYCIQGRQPFYETAGSADGAGWVRGAAKIGKCSGAYVDRRLRGSA